MLKPCILKKCLNQIVAVVMCVVSMSVKWVLVVIVVVVIVVKIVAIVVVVVVVEEREEKMNSNDGSRVRTSDVGLFWSALKPFTFTWYFDVFQDQCLDKLEN